MSRTMLTSLAIIAGMVVVFLFLMKNFQENFIFFPEELPQEYEFDFRIPFEEKFFEPEEGVKLHGLYFKADKPKGVVLYFHGNAGSMRNWGMVCEDFVPLGYDILVMDYRQYGKSRGKLSEEALLNDAAYCYEHLKNEMNRKEEEIIVYGRSLGTGPAMKLAADYNPGKVILETPFYNFKKLASVHMPFLPLGMLLEYNFPNDKWMRQTRSPVYIVHGTNDEIVPFEQGRELAQLLDDHEEKFFPVEGGNHNNLNQFDEYHRFLKKVLK